MANAYEPRITNHESRTTEHKTAEYDGSHQTDDIGCESGNHRVPGFLDPDCPEVNSQYIKSGLGASLG